MRGRVAFALVVGAGLTVAAQSPRGTHLNPLVDLLKNGQAIFGTTAPSIPRPGAGGGRRGAAGTDATATPAPTPSPAPPVRTPADLAKDTLAHPEIDYFFISMENAVDPGLPAMIAYQDALVEAGSIATSPVKRMRAPISAKTPDISRDPAAVVPNVSKQLNAGVTTILFVHVDNAQELEQGIAAMRFASKGGTRPDAIGDAPKYWGLTEKEYRDKADVWPLNPNGELLAWAIVETPEGLANLPEIAQVKGLSALIVGAGTLGGVFSTTGADGRRVRDDVAWEAAIQKILATCKEYKKPCGYPAFANDIEARMKQGFSVFIIQAFNESGFQAVEIGRKAAGRK
jgi:2-keto-3-deoxy-L-rhamnonate aldolase RhmA